MSIASSKTPPAPVAGSGWKWVCEICYRTTPEVQLPKGWALVWQSAICPKCVREATILNLGYANLRGGQWAGQRKDPRGRTPVAAPAGSASPFDKRGADRLAYECARAVTGGKIDSRHPIADALLDYLDIGCVGGPSTVPEWMDAYCRKSPNAGGQP